MGETLCKYLHCRSLGATTRMGSMLGLYTSVGFRLHGVHMQAGRQAICR